MEQKKKNLLKEIQGKDLHICFGSKKLFYAQFHLKENNMTSHKIWLEHFRQARDNRSLYIGSKDEHYCNQILQLTPMVNTGKGNILQFSSARIPRLMSMQEVLVFSSTWTEFLQILS